MNDANTPWPELPPPDAWADTFATVHMWVQIVGKIRLALSPWLNHSWGSTLNVTANGLTTSPIPAGESSLDIDIHFDHHALRMGKSYARQRRLALSTVSVADDPRRVMETLTHVDFAVSITHPPVGCDVGTAFDPDQPTK